MNPASESTPAANECTHRTSEHRSKSAVSTSTSPPIPTNISASISAQSDCENAESVLPTTNSTPLPTGACGSNGELGGHTTATLRMVRATPLIARV